MHIEEDLPSTKKDDKEMSVTGPGPHKHAHLTKYAQCPTDETSQGKYMSKVTYQINL